MSFFFLFEVVLVFFIAIYSFLYSVSFKQSSFFCYRFILQRQRGQHCETFEDKKTDGLVSDKKSLEKELDTDSNAENILDSCCVLWATPDLLHSAKVKRRINSKVPFRIETELFDGIAQLWISGMPSTPPELFAVRLFRACADFHE